MRTAQLRSAHAVLEAGHHKQSRAESNMKTIAASFSVLVWSIIIFSISHAAPNANVVAIISSAEHIAGCVDAVRHSDRGNALFERIETLVTGKEHAIPVFRLKAFFRLAGAPPSVHNALGVIESGQDPDAEIPRITGICVDGTLEPPTAEQGLIDIKSKPGETISISFHLNKDHNFATHLKHTYWRQDRGDPNQANYAVWLAGPFTTLPPADTYPNAKDWQDCNPKSPKHVKFNQDPVLGDDVTFELCPSPNPAMRIYKYALHMDQYVGNGPTIDTVIDPIIINHP
jgi:hypothetical protein